MTRRVLLFGATALAVACEDAPPSLSVNVENDSTSITLDAYPMGYDSLPSELLTRGQYFSQLIDLVVGDSLVAVVELGADPVISFLSVHTGETVASFGKVGQGPGEFQVTALPVGPTSLSSDGWFFDGSAQRLVQLRFSRTGADGKISVAAARTQQLESASFAGFARHGSGFLAVRYGLPGQWELTMLDSAGSKAVPVAVPKYDDDRLPSNQLWAGYHFQLCASPDGAWAGLTYVSAGRVDIVDLRKRSIVAAAVPFQFRPGLTVIPQTRMLAFVGRGRKGYGGCAATNNQLLALFDGTLLEGRIYDDPGSRSPSFVHVFDWSGSLIRVLKLDHFALRIAIDPTGQWLYSIAATEEGFVTVRRTRLES